VGVNSRAIVVVIRDIGENIGENLYLWVNIKYWGKIWP